MSSDDGDSSLSDPRVQDEEPPEIRLCPFCGIKRNKIAGGAAAKHEKNCEMKMNLERRVEERIEKAERRADERAEKAERRAEERVKDMENFFKNQQVEAALRAAKDDVYAERHLAETEDGVYAARRVTDDDVYAVHHPTDSRVEKTNIQHIKEKPSETENANDGSNNDNTAEVRVEKKQEDVCSHGAGEDKTMPSSSSKGVEVGLGGNAQMDVKPTQMDGGMKELVMMLIRESARENAETMRKFMEAQDRKTTGITEKKETPHQRDTYEEDQESLPEQLTTPRIETEGRSITWRFPPGQTYTELSRGNNKLNAAENWEIKGHLETDTIPKFVLDQRAIKKAEGDHLNEHQRWALSLPRFENEVFRWLSKGFDDLGLDADYMVQKLVEKNCLKACQDMQNAMLGITPKPTAVEMKRQLDSLYRTDLDQAISDDKMALLKHERYSDQTSFRYMQDIVEEHTRINHLLEQSKKQKVDDQDVIETCMRYGHLPKFVVLSLRQRQKKNVSLKQFQHEVRRLIPPAEDKPSRDGGELPPGKESSYKRRNNMYYTPDAKNEAKQWGKTSSWTQKESKPWQRDSGASSSSWQRNPDTSSSSWQRKTDASSSSQPGSRSMAKGSNRGPPGTLNNKESQCKFKHKCVLWLKGECHRQHPPEWKDKMLEAWNQYELAKEQAKQQKLPEPSAWDFKIKDEAYPDTRGQYDNRRYPSNQGERGGEGAGESPPPQ